MTYFWKTRTALLAGLVLSGVAVQAGGIDQQVEITKANDSRTLTVRYTGAKATLIELRINGSSMATRTVDGRASGESNFTLDTTKLQEGDNTVEVRLYDSSGKIVGSEKTVVVMDRSASGPVFLNKPQSGATVEGMTEISVGFKSQMKGAYVSFFVNDEFKALKNYAPYTFLWDTNTVTNGWHEVEAWVVNEGSDTFRTQRMRVFVNNPGGRTERQGSATAGSSGFEPRTVGSKNVATGGPKVTVAPVAPKTPETLALVMSENKFVPVVSKSSGTKPAPSESGIMTGARVMRPTGTRIAGKSTTSGKVTAPKVIVKSITTPPTKTVKPVIVAKHVPAAPLKKAATVKVTSGSKLPNIGYYPITIDGRPVNFDVKPRVTDGVALTPFRHLFEHVGGKVDWQKDKKVVDAKGAGQIVSFQIGTDFATVNGSRMGFERHSFLESGRSIVPLSFIQQLLNVDIQFDPSSKHVLISKKS